MKNDENVEIHDAEFNQNIDEKGKGKQSSSQRRLETFLK